MRKIIKYVVIPLIIIILILGSLLYFKYNKKDKDNDNEIIKTLSGTKIKDNIYMILLLGTCYFCLLNHI